LFPWERDCDDYLRRVLTSVVGVALSKVYGPATASGKLPPLKDENRKRLDVTSPLFSTAHALRHADQHVAFYAAALGMSEEALRSSVQWLRETAARLDGIHKEFDTSSDDSVLRSAFNHAEQLASGCGAPHVVAKLQWLRKQKQRHDASMLERVMPKYLSSESESSESSAAKKGSSSGEGTLPSAKRQRCASEASSWSNTSPSPEELVRCASSLSVLQTVMRAHASAPAVQRRACDVLVSMLAASESGAAKQAEAGQLGLLFDIKDAMRRHANDADVQSPACEALAYITLNNAANASEASRLGLLQCIQQAMCEHEGYHVAENACFAIGAICSEDAATRVQAGECGLLADIQRVSAAHPGSQVVQQTVCYAITNVCKYNASNQAEAGRVGLLKSLQAALRMDHSGCPPLGGCQSLYFLLGNMDNKAEAARLGILADLQKVMRQHTGHADMQKIACMCITRLVDHRQARAQAARLGLLEDVGVALSKHANDGVLALRACEAVGCVMSGSRRPAEQLGASGELLEVVMNALDKARRSLRSQIDGA